MGSDRVVPVALELVGFEEDAGHLRIGHLDPIGIPRFVDLRSDSESGGRGGCPDQTDDDRKAHDGVPRQFMEMWENTAL